MELPRMAILTKGQTWSTNIDQGSLVRGTSLTMNLNLLGSTLMVQVLFYMKVSLLETFMVILSSSILTLGLVFVDFE